MASKDVEMTDVESLNKLDELIEKKEATANKEKKKRELTPLEKVMQEVDKNVGIIQTSVEKKDSKLVLRVLHRLTGLRKSINTAEILSSVMSKWDPEAVQFVAPLDGFDQKMGVEIPADESDQMDTSSSSEDVEQAARQATALELPEVKVYIRLLALLYTMDQDNNELACQTATTLTEYITEQNRRSLDRLSAKVWAAYALVQERRSNGDNSHIANICSSLLKSYRTACLQHNEPAQATLIISILRFYLLQNLYVQADKFRLNANFPESRTTYQHARYLFYLGKINSIQLRYSDALVHLEQALNKAPRNRALGFRQQVTKFMVIVNLLTGSTPDRTLFRLPDLGGAYFQLTQAVRVGDLVKFNSVVETYKAKFLRDNTFSLINRLRHNVIKTGLRKINLSYSRISLLDICEKLNLDTVQDTEYIVAKAINDGVIEAMLDRKEQYMYSKDNLNVYSTSEPQEAFHKRIEFCNTIHNGAVKALRFPPNAHKSQSELAEEQAEREKEAKKKAEAEKEEESKKSNKK